MGRVWRGRIAYLRWGGRGEYGRCRAVASSPGRSSPPVPLSTMWRGGTRDCPFVPPLRVCREGDRGRGPKGEGIKGVRTPPAALRGNVGEARDSYFLASAQLAKVPKKRMQLDSNALPG